MPRKTKEADSKKENILSSLFSKKSSSSKDKSTSKKKTPKAKKATSKTKSEKEIIPNDKEVTKTKAATKKTTKKNTAKKTKSNSAKNKVIASKTSLDKKTTVTATNDQLSSSEDKKSSVAKVTFSPEYYDLPYKYNQTVIKILAQTPTNLFVYWEISDEDRESLKKQYGKYFFEITKPVLVIHNQTMNYSFEVDINDFANSWYLHVNDSNCEYQIELGRRPIPINYSYIPQYDLEKEGPIKPVESSYIYISSSNELEAPNDHILFNTKNKLYFRNIKTNQIIEKDIKDFPFVADNNKFISIYKLYEDLYKEEISNNSIDLNNPSSGARNPSSGNPSSKFR